MNNFLLRHFFDFGLMEEFMAYFKVTGSNNQAAIINGSSVTKVVDFGPHRSIYQGSDTNFIQVKDTLDSILKSLKGS